MTNPPPNHAKNSTNVWMPLLFSALTAFGIFIGYRLQSTMSNPQKVSVLPSMNSREVGKIEEILRFIDAKYVEDADKNALMDKAINSILSDLDPHSTYIPADELEGINASLKGSFDGIGVQFTIIDDTIQVITPMSGGPSEKVGIRAGDKIIMVNDSTVAGISITNTQIMHRLRGEKGTSVNVGIQRIGNPDLLNFTIIRDKIPDYSLDTHYMVDDKIGYVKINRFSGTTYEEFMTAIEELNEIGMKDLVIDLRGNPGGYLQAATKILGQLFAQKRLLVYTEGRTQRRNEYNSTGRNFYDVDKVAVLIDEGSASASEILAGAIQDADRGKIIGRRSFGKGLVQEQYNLSDGAALRLTVARYYTPSGRSIQKPYKGKDVDYEQDIADRFEAGEMKSQDSIDLADSTKYYTENGRVVYGGGGITPDIFIPLDPTFDNPYFMKSSPYLMEFAVSYLNKNRNTIEKFTSLEEFIEKYTVDDTILQAFDRYVRTHDVKKDKTNFSKSKLLIASRIKANFARDFYGEKGFYAVLNADDTAYQRAVSELSEQ